MKAVKSGFAALALATALAAGLIGPTSAQQADQVGQEWVCYYDRVTYELLYCRWE